jgi:hypothetical protein
MHDRNGVAYQPDLSRLSSIPGGPWPLWGDLTLSLSPAGVSWLAHDAPFTVEPPLGMNAALTDGSVAWSSLRESEVYFVDSLGGQQYYWPRPQD